jgi:hypothetical protein
LSECRIVTRVYTDSGVVGLYLSHARDSSVSKVPLNAVPEHATIGKDKLCPSLRRLLHESHMKVRPFQIPNAAPTSKRMINASLTFFYLKRK